MMKAWLEGDPIDLFRLAALLSAGDTRVVRDDEKDAFYLTAQSIDSPPTGMTCYQVAQRLLPRINSVGRSDSAGFRAVRLTGICTGEDGSVFAFPSPAVAEARFGLNVTIMINGQPQVEQSSAWSDRVALADTHGDVSGVMSFLGQEQPLGWIELYKVHEIIRHAVNPHSIVGLGWADKTSDSAFRVSANNPGVSGAGARHARMSSTPTHTMSLVEGRTYVGGLVTRWLDWLAANE